MPNPVSTGLPHPASYTSKPGYVIDNVTGLWWQEPMDADNNQNNNCSAGCTQPNAVTYCANLTLAGHGDWRLPTRIELVSIVDYTEVTAFNAAAFPKTPVTQFWTSSPCAATPGSAWYVYFHATCSSQSQISQARVRCVR